MNIQIWQIKMDLDDDIRHDISYMNYEYVNGQIEDFNKKWKDYYKMVYELNMPKKEGQSNYDLLEELFDIFNNNDTPVPSDFKGHSLSMSDIVVIDEISYYCDSFGWRIIE